MMNISQQKEKMMKLKLLVILAMVASFVGCNGVDKEQLKKIMKDNPEILFEVIKAHPADFMMTVQDAVKAAQEDMGKKREEEEKKKIEESFNKPLEPKFRADETYYGNPAGPITIVEYSDFECPFCTRGFTTLKEVMAKYQGKVRFVFKNLPLSFHKNAEIAAQYYEAIRMQSPEKSLKFHDTLFQNQEKLKNGEAYLIETAKALGVNMAKLKTDITSDAVKNRIEEDKKEAGEFGIEGTPGFVVNGIPVKGAYPTSHFVQIIDELVKRGKLTL